MPTDRADLSTDTDGPIPIRRCACGRVALARCWLGQSAGRWLVSCDQRLPDTPEAA